MGKTLILLLVGAALLLGGCARYSTTRQIIPSSLTHEDVTGENDMRYVQTKRQWLLGLNLFGFQVVDIDANDRVKDDIASMPRYRIANLQVTHGCFNDYGSVLTWIFTVPICRLQYDIMEIQEY